MAAYTETERRKSEALNLPVIRTRSDLRRVPPLPVLRANLEGVREVAGALAAGGDIPGRPPTGDERLTGEGGAELGARAIYPTLKESLRQASEQGLPTGTGDPRSAALRAQQSVSAAPSGYAEGPATARYRELLAATDVEDENGRLRSGARMAATPIQQTDSLGNAVGQILGKFVGGTMLNPTADEQQIDRPRELAAAQAGSEAEAAEEKRQREWEAHVADVDYKKSAAEWNRKRPELAQADDMRELVKFDIANRLKDPRPFDPNDEHDVDLLTRARAAGMRVSPGSFGDHKNPFTIEILDPTDPAKIRKTRLGFDRASGKWSPVTDDAGAPVVTNRVQPVGDDGRTPNQREADDDRDRAFEATQEHRAKTFGLSSERLRETMLNGLSSRAAREFSTATRGLFERRREVEKRIEDYSKRSASLTVDPAEARRRIGELEAERDGLTSQIDAERGKALGTMSAAPGASPSGARPGRYAGQRMPRAKLPEAAKALGLSEQDAEALIKREGGVIY